MNTSDQAAQDNNMTLDCAPLSVYFLDVPRDNHFDTFLLAMIVINAVMAVVASCSNAVVIYTISRTPSLQTPSNILILGLAISDLSVGIFSQPSFCLFRFYELRRNLDLYCSFGKMYMYITLPLAAISFLTLTAITADRFLAVHLHLRYQDIITTKRVGITLGFIWILGSLFAVYSAMFFKILAVVISSCCFFAFLLFLDVYFIFRVCLVIRRHSLQIQSQQSAQQPINMVRFRKSAMVMVFVIGAFILCYVPYVIFTIMLGVVDEPSYGLRIGFNISETLVMSNGILNPIIYCWRIEDIRTAAVLLMRKMLRQREN
ncbi:adrenocorticotropic hormone receptor-like [Actinia tenebrosa]|uniref:Adrenocorticotropic hormone receptor-like n=1 Tax=Actinia tenebrosa TaxID=6105 RepID=A0A6P8HF07_ACTTE|nr:adrenocorticotropic hormone receptor-like [Actinia tenebrosa]